MPYRKGEFYHKTLPASYGGNQWVTVNATAGSTVSKSGNVFTPPATETYQYDADGNLAQDARWNYTWDAENRLIRLTGRVAGVAPSQVDYEYDWRGRRIKKVVTGGATSKYLYDGWNLIAEIDSNNALVRSFMWGLDLNGSVQGAGGVGGLIYTKAAAGNAHFCAFDGNGNVMALVDGNNGNVSAEYEYGAFGESIRATGPLAASNPFRFSTKFTDDESDFLCYGYRYYNASTGRWLSRDPLGEEGFETARGNSRRRGDFDEIDSDEPSMAEISEGMNLYWFVKNRPTVEIDPFGLFAGFGYGNFCGWSRRGPGDPIDAVDAACQKHDNCLATWADACKFKFCNIRFCSDVAKADCKGDKACKKAKRKILTGCGIIVPIPPFIWM